MTPTEKNAAPHTALHDVLGLGLIVLGAVFGASAVMYLKEGRGEDAAAFTVLMSGFVEALGAPSILWLCLGLLFVGGRLFLFGGEGGSLRDLIGFVATALGLSILMGAMSQSLGGHFGHAIGGAMSDLGSVVAGVLLGLAALLIPAWVVWLRVAPPALVERANAMLGSDPESENQDGSGQRRGGRAAPSPKVATEDLSGVTTAEADALLPDADRAAILDALRTANRKSATFLNHAPSPYPPDVRREGGIPEGTRAIDVDETPTPQAFGSGAAPASGHAVDRGARPANVGSREPATGDQSRAGTVQQWTPGSAAGGKPAAGRDLVRAADAGGAVEAARAPAAELTATPARSAPAAAPAPIPSSGGAVDAARAVPIPKTHGPVGSPSWERDEDAAPDFRELADDADDADDDGPRSARGAVDADDEEVAAALTAEQDDDDLDEAAEDAEEPTDAELVDAYGTPLDVVAKLRGEPESASDDDDLDHDEELADDDEALEPNADATAESEDFDDDEEDDDADDADLVPAQPAMAEDEIEEPDVAEPEVVLQPVQASLFDTLEASAAPAAPAERTVVLEPQAAAVDPLAEGSDDLVYRSGLLFLKQGRVAVSMLQREFGLDFKQATAVLDQLQSQGLIGPYLGGQRRDILLTAEQWRAKIGATP